MFVPETALSAEYVVPFDLWQNLLDAIVPHLEEDEKLLDALCAIGDHWAGPIDQEQMERSLEIVRERLFGPRQSDGVDHEAT